MMEMPLIQEAADGDPRHVEWLIEAGADVNAKMKIAGWDLLRCTDLHISATRDVSMSSCNTMLKYRNWTLRGVPPSLLPVSLVN